MGLPLVFGDDRAPTSVYVQVPGVGLRIEGRAIQKGAGPKRYDANSDAALCSHLSSTRSHSPPRAITFTPWSSDVLPLAADKVRDQPCNRISFCSRRSSWP